MSQSHFPRALIAALVGGGSFLVGSSSMASPMTWVDNQLTYDFGFSGGLPIGGLTSDSRHFDTISNPVVGDHSISFLNIGPGTIHGGYDAYFWDPASHDSNFYGLNQNFELGSNGQIPGTSDPDPSTRTLWMTVSVSHVLRVTAPMGVYGFTVSGAVSPWSLAVLESGSWNGSTFTPLSQVLDLTIPYAGVTILQPGDYRVRGELAFSHVVTGASSVNNYFTMDMHPIVPTPGTAALLGLGGLMAARRRRAPHA